MVNVVVWLLVGGLVGWMTNAIMYPNDARGHVLNVCIGAAAAALSGWFLSPLIGADSMEKGLLNMGALLVAVVSAILLLAVITLFQREEPSQGPAAMSDEP